MGVFHSVFVQKRSGVNGASLTLDGPGLASLSNHLLCFASRRSAFVDAFVSGDFPDAKLRMSRNMECIFISFSDIIVRTIMVIMVSQEVH